MVHILPEIIQTFNLKMPAHFSSVPYDAIYARVFSQFQRDRASGKVTDDFVWQQFTRSWAAVAYRFRANFEHSQEYVKIVEPLKFTITALDSEVQYAQERELFNFFVSGLSTIESLCYSLYFLGALIEPTIFTYKPQKLRDIYPDGTKKKYEKYADIAKTPETDAISNELKALLSAPGYRELKEIRNPLAHSIVPIRTNWVDIVESVYDGTSSSSQGTKWLNDIPLDINTTETRQSWLTQTLEAVIKATDLFTFIKF